MKALIDRVIRYQTDKLAGCVGGVQRRLGITQEWRVANGVVVSYGAKKQRKRTNSVTDLSCMDSFWIT